MIVGGGRVGQALADMGAGADLVVRRGEAVPADAPAGPIVVCTRNDDLQAVVDGTPPERRKGAPAAGACECSCVVRACMPECWHMLCYAVGHRARSLETCLQCHLCNSEQTPGAPLLHRSCLHAFLSTSFPTYCCRADLVFIQNGMLQPWLDERGLGEATQVRPA